MGPTRPLNREGPGTPDGMFRGRSLPPAHPRSISANPRQSKGSKRFFTLVALLMSLLLIGGGGCSGSGGELIKLLLELLDDLLGHVRVPDRCTDEVGGPRPALPTSPGLMGGERAGDSEQDRGLRLLYHVRRPFHQQSVCVWIQSW